MEEDGFSFSRAWKNSNMFHLTIWFFQFITGITFRWYYVLWCIFTLMMWIGVSTKLRIYRVPPYPIKWSFRGFGYLWLALILMLMLMYKKYLGVSHRNKCYSPSDVRFVTYLVDFECHPCGIFEGIGQPK